MHAPIKYVEKGLSVARQRRLGRVQRAEQDRAEPVVHAEVVRQAAAEVLPEDEAAARLAARDRLALPDLRARGAPGDSRRQAGRQRPAQREGRRDQGDHPRARRQDPDGEGLPDPRPLRRRDGDGHRLLQAPRGGLPGPRHPRAQRREAAQPRQQHDQARPRLGAHGRPDQPLQHDVRPVLHGREPGRVRPRARRGKTSRRCSTTRSRIKPQRQMSVQFSGGEPTMSPYFLDAVRYARKVGYNSVQAATNGIEFAKSPEFAKAAAEAGLRYAYLQFDGIGNAANSHRRVGNLFDVKLRAIENLHERRRRHRAGHHDRQRRQQRAGRPHHRVRARQPEEDQLPVVPAGVVHRPRRGDHRRAPRTRSATRCRTWRTT